MELNELINEDPINNLRIGGDKNRIGFIEQVLKIWLVVEWMQERYNASNMVACEDKLKNSLLGNIGEELTGERGGEI